MLRKKRILIVDDDESLLESLTKILQVEGYDVETAKTGEEAVEKFKTQLYNLALLDIRLPDMDGTELLKIIDGHIPRTVRIMITGYPSTENAVKALNLQADAYVMKPVDPKELLKTIQERLKEQDEADKVTEEKVTRWIKTRAERL
jgi:DNA-binding response OmpR family regulator